MKLPEGWPTETMIEAGAKIAESYDKYVKGMPEYKVISKEILEAALAAAPTPPTQECKCDMRTKLVGDGCEACNPELAAEMAAQEDEPVAEIRLDQGEAIIDLTKILEQPVGTKFYTRPADDKLRKAAEEVVERFFNGRYDGIMLQRIRNLRAALEEQ